MSEVRRRPTSLRAQTRSVSEEVPSGQGGRALERLASARSQLVLPGPAGQHVLRAALREVQHALVRGLRTAAHEALTLRPSGVCTVCFSLPASQWGQSATWVDARVSASGSRLVLEAAQQQVCPAAVTLALLDGGAILLRSEAGDHHQLRMWRLGAGTHTGLRACELAALEVLPDGSTRSTQEQCADAP